MMSLNKKQVLVKAAIDKTTADTKSFFVCKMFVFCILMWSIISNKVEIKAYKFKKTL